MILTLILEGNKSLANIISDRAKSYLCRDKTCLVDTKFCKVSAYCSIGIQKCDNGYCVRKNDQCSIFSEYCPKANLRGACVDDIIKFTTAFNIQTCSEGEFYCMRMNKGLKKRLDYIYINLFLYFKGYNYNYFFYIFYDNINYNLV